MWYVVYITILQFGKQLRREVVIWNQNWTLNIANQGVVFFDLPELKMQLFRTIVIELHVLHDVELVPLIGPLPIQLLKVMLDSFGRQRVGMNSPQLLSRVGALAKNPSRGRLLGIENVGCTKGGKPLTIAAPGGLGDGIETRGSTIDHRQIDIYTGLDELR